MQNLKQACLAELRLQWRIVWVNHFLPSDSDTHFQNSMYFYDVWKNLVAVNLTLPYSATREFVHPALLIVDELPKDIEITIKSKQLDVLNEILCYGSTLAIQSDIPVEASDISQRLLRLAQTESFFERFHIPSTQPGMAGNAKIMKTAEEKCISVPVLQKVVILYLKAVAVVVREAQAISSSDESASDSSLSSR